jgi:tRNA(Ile)-lysidine synthase
MDPATADAVDPLEPWRARFADATRGLAAPVVVACSGGADSVALLALAVDAVLAPVAVHIDHGLRLESAAESACVHELASSLSAGFRAVRVDVEDGSNLEARARDARYAALDAARVEVGAAVVLVGHTADDQAETVLLNVLRGAASSGLAGMAARRGTVVRPLLDARRADTRALCAALGLPVFDDPMNDDRAFRRVAIRHDVLPYLSALAERDLVPVLARQAEILRSDSEFLDELAARAWPGGKGDDNEARAASLAALPLPLARRALRQWLGAPPPSLAEIDRVLAVASGDVRATELGGARAVRRSAGLLLLTVG